MQSPKNENKRYYYLDKFGDKRYVITESIEDSDISRFYRARREDDNASVIIHKNSLREEVE